MVLGIGLMSLRHDVRGPHTQCTFAASLSARCTTQVTNKKGCQFKPERYLNVTFRSCAPPVDWLF